MTARETGAVELKPCPNPWCREPEPFVEFRGARLYRVRCKGCGVATEACYYADDARRIWNTRPQPTPSATGEIVEKVNRLFAQAYEADDCHAMLECDPRDIIALQTELRHLETLAEQQAATIAERDAEIARLTALLNTPEVEDFAKGTALEAAHQRERWGADHDAGKTPFDWFWLIGYLAQKAASAHVEGNTEKALHHTISTAAALANWHLALTGTDTRMRPGIDTPEEARATLERTASQ